MRKRLALTGAGGMLGREIVREATERSRDLVAWDRAALDVTQADAVRDVIGAADPEIVIHCAAWTDVDACEGDPERAMRVNGEGTANVVRGCEAEGARLIMVSTDYVFSGKQRDAYREDDPPAPVSAYGRSKLAGERAVLGMGTGGLVARTAWMYADHGRNFLLTMLRLGRQGGEVRVVDDQRGTPTFAADLASRLLDLADGGGSGVYHATNSGSCTWFEFARKIFSLAGLPARLLPVSTEEFPRPAPRPASSVLADTRGPRDGLPPSPAWEDALVRCLARLRE